MKHIKTTAGQKHYQWDYQELLYLVHVLSQAKNRKIILNLFLDIHTYKEISEIIRRVIIASMLQAKKTYHEINKKTSASPGTITKVHEKFFREKSVLAEVLEKAGSFEDFYQKINKVDTRDWLTKMMDRQIYKRGGWLFMEKE